MAHSHSTQDHDTIREWIEQRGGRPATVTATMEDGKPGLLRVDFPGYDGGEDSLEEIDWEAFFKKFDEQGLTFLYQEQTVDGGTSRFCKFVSKTE